MQRGFGRDRRRVLLALGASAATAGCGLLSRGPLEAPPPWFQPAEPRPPVVFLPGAFGARLRNRVTGAEIWPVGMPDLLVSSYAQLELPLDPETADAAPDEVFATDLVEEAGIVEFYGALVSALTSAGGYRRERPGTAVEGGPPRLYAFLYDWRRDLADAARALDGLIEQVRADHGQPGLQVDLVAHSGGGLVARYYLLHGGRPLDQAAAGRPDFAGAAKVNSVVAVGVPELGMARAAAALMEGEPVVLSRVLPEVLFTTQSNFQLLPHGDDTWLVDGAGSPIAADSCDLGLWRQLGAGIFDSAVRARVRDAARSLRAGRERLALLERAFGVRLERARLFRQAIRAGAVPASVPYASIGGDCRPTQARLLVEEFLGEVRVRTHPHDVHRPVSGLDYDRLMLEMGDGLVTRSSVVCRPSWPAGGAEVPRLAEAAPAPVSVCASHNQLVVNADCQRALLRALGHAAEPAVPPS